MKKVLLIVVLLISITFLVGGLTLAYLATNTSYFTKEKFASEVAPIAQKVKEVAPDVASTLSKVADTLPQLAGNTSAEQSRPSNSPRTIYKNALANGWEDRSWDANVNFNGFPAYDGQSAMIIDFSAGDGAVYLRAAELIDVTGYTSLRFWIHGGVTGGQQLGVALVDETGEIIKTVPVNPPAADNWQQVDILLTDLEAPEQIHGVVWQDTSSGLQPVFYVDEVAFVDEPAAGSYAKGVSNTIALTIYADKTLYGINPLIYGMNFAPEDVAEELDLPLNRWGGNATSRYNYLEDATNVGSNWYFENKPPDPPNPNLPNDSSADGFVQQNIRTETETLFTLPLMGWVARANYACGFSMTKYGAQIDADGWRPDCGNGILKNGDLVMGTTREDTSMAVRPEFIQDWMNHLKGRFGAADAGGVRFYNLDNEPMLWSHTHRDIQQTPLGIDEFWAITEAYASAAKEADPAGQILGPVEWGWSNYFLSDLDSSADLGFWEKPPDRVAHDDLDLVAWYLREMARYEERTGQRLLDYLDLHYYPQAIGVAFSQAGDESTQALRLRTTRSLWDRTYVDESWIAEPVYQIPRMRDWVETYYPGTKLAITEYNWGGLEHINGAVAQAEVLGIFGRERLDLAAIWAPPTTEQPGMYAFRMYRNYDGQGSKFGDVSIGAESAQEDVLSVFAAQREADEALTVIVMNKSHVPVGSSITLEGYTGSSGEVYRYSAVNLQVIEQLTDQAVANGAFETTFPAMSITLFVFPAN